ncbi:MAG TPA: molybdate ABC transporter permease subunit [Rectinemataceae bacterium]|nr:molybdate ABC transporter permease subunit [Rectinemataceae bacterium]
MNLDLLPFRVSLILGLWVTIILLLICFPIAWVFARSTRRWTLFVESLATLPLVLSPTVLGFYLLLLLSPKGPLGAFFLSVFHVRLAFSFEAIVIGSCVSSLPFMLSALKSGIQAIPAHILDASSTLGKGRLETLFRVAMPNMKSSIAAGVINTFAHTLGEFGVVLMIGGSIPGVTKVVSIAVYERVESLDFAGAQAYAVILVALGYLGVLLLNLIQRREGRR